MNVFSKFLFAAGSLFLLAFGVAKGTAQSLHAAPPVHHALMVRFEPTESTARIQDVMTWYPGDSKGSSLRLLLHAHYKMERTVLPDQPGWTVEISPALEEGEKPPLTRIEIQKPADQPWPAPLTLKFEYSGKVYDPLRFSPEEPNSGSPTTPPQEGLLLWGASYYYPQLEGHKDPPDLLTFQLTVNTPADWKVISQGGRSKETILFQRREVTWESREPMEEIFLIADRFVEYQDTLGPVQIYAFLRNEEPELAHRYLQTAKKYIKFFEKFLGPYPYPKFALVENSRQTGYGMPSFTLLGSRIIRFPFILHTSYPHEILHNWWGNGVYIDPKGGNWAEGLTAYLSDHLLRELEGNGERYRFQELMKYLNYVNESNDFPLVEFRAREDMASQAVGYGKTLMMLHMLRTDLGNEVFLQGLRTFYETHRFRFAGFDDLRKAFESVSGRNLVPFFEQWTRRTGAPELELSSASYRKTESRFDLTFEVRQKQSGPPFEILLPVSVWLAGVETPRMGMVSLTKKSQTFTLRIPEEPEAVLIDPYTEVFRKLNRKEVPPSIGQTYGAQKVSWVLPTKEEYPDVLMGYYQFAQSLGEKNGKPGALLKDDMLIPLPAGSLWIFGRENGLAEHVLPQLQWYGVEIKESGVTIEGKYFPWADHCFVFTVQRPAGKEGSLTWVIAGSAQSIPGLIRKLPHYGKYGYLVFKGGAPDNQIKGTWPLRRAGLLKPFKKGDYPLPPQTPLVDFKP